MAWVRLWDLDLVQDLVGGRRSCTRVFTWECGGGVHPEW